MEEKLKLLMESNAWDARFNLPTVPMHNNPWIYIAYCMRAAGYDSMADGDYNGSRFHEFLTSLAEQFRKCETVAGYLDRWPDGGKCSHDDLMGAAYLSAPFAARLDNFLSTQDGVYAIPGSQTNIEDLMTRFIFFAPFVKASAGFKISPWSQLLFILHVLDDAFFTKPGDTNSLLKIWLMAPAMREFAWCKIALSFWAWNWTRRGYTPKSVFTNNYLTEVPVLSQLAREDFV